jgi:hypothetical protein
MRPEFLTVVGQPVLLIGNATIVNELLLAKGKVVDPLLEVLPLSIDPRRYFLKKPFMARRML